MIRLAPIVVLVFLGSSACPDNPGTGDHQDGSTAGSDAGGDASSDGGPPVDGGGALCGNGVVDSGEQCDGDPCCDANCVFTQDFAACAGGICRQGMCRPDNPSGTFDVYLVLDPATGNHDIDYPGYHPPGQLKSFAFFAEPTPGADLQPLYNCRVGGTNTFVSPNMDCEGQTSVDSEAIGWVHTAPATGRFEIMRCRASNDHAVGGEASCPYALEGSLGYSDKNPQKCGDWVVDAGESCDGMHCCSGACQWAPDGSACPLGVCTERMCRQDVSDADSSVNPLACLDDLFQTAPGQAAELNIPIELNGRPTIGDLNNDGVPDFVMATRDRIAAYTICGEKLWDVAVQTNWDFSSHYFWNLTTYGWVGDVDGDGAAEFVHLGNDWRTVYVRDGITGVVENTVVGPGSVQWMYVFGARRAGDVGQEATRLVLSGPGYASNFDFATFDLRSGTPVSEWTYSHAVGAAGSVYLSPQTANLDGVGGDEIFYGALALSESGSMIWRFDVGGISQLSAIHAATVADIDPALPGLESVYSVYAPNSGQPSLVTYGASTGSEVWRAYSPHSELHPHQHAVGDFDLSHDGLETLARNANGFNHWMVNATGEVIRADWRVFPGWDNAGEYVQAIYWDGEPSAEVLYLERHVSDDGTHAIRSRMVVVSPRSERVLTGQLAGGVMEDTRGWTGVTSQPYFNPYEAAGLVVDLIGDGREEVLTWGNGKLSIYYNTGDQSVTKRWGDPSYETLKKMSCYLYSPR